MRIIYMLDSRYSAVTVGKYEVLNETEKTYKLRLIESVLGRVYYVPRSTSKAQHKWFDTAADALAEARDIYQKYASQLQAQADEATSKARVINEALEMAREAKPAPEVQP